MHGLILRCERSDADKARRFGGPLYFGLGRTVGVGMGFIILLAICGGLVFIYLRAGPMGCLDLGLDFQHRKDMIGGFCQLVRVGLTLL